MTDIDTKVYDDIVLAMENARDNGHDIDDWSADELAYDIAAYDPDHGDTPVHVIKQCILKWRATNNFTTKETVHV